MNVHEAWMGWALKEAKKALENDEVPVGAVVVHEGEIIGRGYNQTETLNDPTAHAEMIAISAATNTLKSWRLENCSLYVTLEPCAMCAGAIVLARVETLIYGAADPKSGACGSLRNVVQDHRLNHRSKIVSGVLKDESKDILDLFFRRLGEKKDKTDRC